MRSFRYFLTGSQQPQHADLLAQAIAAVRLESRIRLHFTPNPDAPLARSASTLHYQLCFDLKFCSPTSSENILSP